METLADILRYGNIVVWTALAAVSFRHWRRHGGDAARWIALTFALLAAVALTFALIPNEAASEPAQWLRKATVAALLAFPYFLYRFTASFSPPRRHLDRLALALTGVVVAWTLLMPGGFLREPPSSGWLAAYIAAVLSQWTALSLIVAARLWWNGTGLPSVARNRMRLLSVAAIGMTLTFVLAALASASAPTRVDVLIRLLAIASAVVFFVGFAPPAWLRHIWRRPELDKLRRAIVDLMGAKTIDDISENVLPQMANLVSARAVALVDDDGATVGAYRATAEMLAEARDVIEGDGRAGGRETSVIHLRFPFGSLVVWTSPYAPFFSNEELELLHSLGALTNLAIDHCRLFAEEREARLGLERADELKSQFIALASHELRTPAAVIYGIASTLHFRGDQLQAEQLHELRHTLFEQTERMSRLVDQLLDLSRLEASAIPIHPEPIPVRTRVEELVFTQAAERASDVSIDVAPELEAVVDPAAFDRIVANLITNAFRYGKPPVRIAAEQRDRHFRLTVEDRGPGVAPDFVPQLFERFARGQGSRDRAGGAGLGLAIAQSYAHAHGGHVLYASAHPHGARFELVLPRAQS